MCFGVWGNDALRCWDKWKRPEARLFLLPLLPLNRFLAKTSTHPFCACNHATTLWHLKLQTNHGIEIGINTAFHLLKSKFDVTN